MTNKPDSSETTTRGISRRALLSTGAAAGAGGVLTGLSAAPAKADEIQWDHEVDVIVVGSGAAGLPAAIAARDQGVSVMVVEQNFDIGGIAILSGGATYLGGGTWLQAEGGIDDNPDAIVADWTQRDHPLGRYNDREIVRKYADECVATFDFLTANGIRWEPLGAPDRIDSVPRRARPHEWPNPHEVVVAGQRGSGLQRPLENSARAKGVEFLLMHRMVKIHRESPTAGSILGITAMEVDRHFQPRHRTVNIRARRGVVLAAGGSGNNIQIRRIYDPRLTEEYQVHGDGWSPRTGDAVMLGLEVGGSLWGTANQTNEADGQLSKGRIAVRSNYHGLSFQPESPNFFRERATGLRVEDWQNIVLVKENGQRFYNETVGSRDYDYFAAAMDWTGDPHKLNGGGPIWAIFDAAAAEREGWDPNPPYVDMGGYFFVADTLEELAEQIIANQYQWRPMPGNVLRETIERYNGFVDLGEDEDFAKPSPQHRLETPPFYAAWATPCVHDTYAGLRINTSAQVQDVNGQVIPGLYAAGECAGGFSQHGLGQSQVYGRIAGIHAGGGELAPAPEQLRQVAHLSQQYWPDWAG